MKMKSIVWNIALIAVFGGLGLTQFIENVKTVQILGLFASGVVVGQSLASIVYALKPTQKTE